MATSSTGGGTTTSFSNTPQAQADYLTTTASGVLLTEDLGCIIFLDVMANDLGGNAKILWSLDDGTSASTATKVYAPADLLTQDTARTEALSSDYSAKGAHIWITADGKVGYDSSAMQAALQSLAAGETLVDSFTYAIRLANGTLSWTTANVLFVGANDGVAITAAGTDAIGAVTEDAGVVLGQLSDTGSIVFNDIDLADAHTSSVVKTCGTLGGTLTMGAASENATTASGTVGWTYKVDNSAVQYLAAGETATEKFTVTISDGHGGTVNQVVEVTITGTNDAATVSSDSKAVSEGNTAAALNTSGQLTIVDPDTGEAHVVAQTNAHGSYGDFTIDANGAWSYSGNGAHDELTAGQVVQDQFTVTSQDGTGTGTVTVTITGTNDAPTLNAAAAPILNSVNEDAGAPVGAVGTLVSALVDLNPPASGLNNVTDADAGAFTGIALTDTNSANGSWYYSTNGGSTWATVDSVSSSNALLLAANANTRLYFSANANFNGTVADAITFRAWDQTGGVAGTKVDTSVNGGTSAFSTATDSANITVSAVNDAPVATSDVLWVSNSTNATFSLSALLGNDTDVDGLALGITSFSAAAGQFASAPTLNGDGTFSFSTNSTGGTFASPTVHTFTYTVSDGAGGTSTGSVTVNVVGVDTGGNNQDTINISSATNYQGAYIDSAAAQDTVIDGFANATIIGGAGNDNLNGGSGNDAIRGGAGQDTMDGGAGIDLLDFSDAASGFTLTFTSGSGSVNNSVTALGNDSYSNMEGVIGSSTGADTLNGSTNADVFYGLGGNDTLNGNDGNDTLRGGAGNDTIDGGNGTDLLDFSDATNALNFTLVQSSSNTTVAAGATPGLGQDIYKNIEGVIGSAYNDILVGSSGNDVIIGGAGADTMSGAGGSDTFKFRNGDAAAVDTITDFNPGTLGSGGDVLDISDLLVGAPTLNGGNVAQYLSVHESGGNSILSIDRDGAGTAFGFQDFVVLQGVTGLSLNTLLTNGNVDWTP